MPRLLRACKTLKPRIAKWTFENANGHPLTSFPVVLNRAATLLHGVSRMKRILLSLSLIALVAQVPDASAQYRRRWRPLPPPLGWFFVPVTSTFIPTQVSAFVRNVWNAPIVCSLHAFGWNGRAWANSTLLNQLIYPGHYVYVYVNNYTGFPFAGASAYAHCRWF